MISVQLGVHSGTAWQGSWAATATGSTGLASSNWLACVTLNERCTYDLHSIDDCDKRCDVWTARRAKTAFSAAPGLGVGWD